MWGSNKVVELILDGPVAAQVGLATSLPGADGPGEMAPCDMMWRRNSTEDGDEPNYEEQRWILQ